MRLPGKAFWGGFVLGMVLMGGAGLWVLNQQWKSHYDSRAQVASVLAGWVNGLRVRFEAGDPREADAYHRSIAWSLHREHTAFQCLADRAWLFSVNAGRDCAPTEDAWPIPEDWPIPGLEDKRRSYERAEASRPDETEPGA